MEIEELIILLDQKIASFLDRIEINDIIGTSTQFDQTSLTKEDVDKYLNENVGSLVEVRNAIMLNDINFYSTHADETDEDRRPTNQSEHAHLSEQKDDLLVFFDSIVLKACRKGENAYSMNSLFRTIIRRIDVKSSEMNFERWFVKKPRTKDNGYYILLDNERFFFNEMQVEFVRNCASMIREELYFRQDLLQELKNSLVNIFSEHLILPDHEFLPKIKFNGDKVDISELIYAMFISERLEDPEIAKSILLEMFDMPKGAYSKDVSYIRNTRNGKSKFLSELAGRMDQIKKT